jgi:prolyl-tRNA synthetase
VEKGLFSYLPLGIRILEKLKAVLRRALEELGGQEVLVPFLAPQSLFHSSGRLAWIGKEAKSIRTNDGQNLLLSPTHEESMVDLVRRVPHGFKELPLLIYQFQTKFRDEENPWGGLFRTKEFLMNDAYSFHRSFTGINNFFPKMYKLYCKLFRSLGLHCLAAEASVGYMAGEKAYEFLMPYPGGDAKVISCPSCGYTANAEVAVAQDDNCVQSLLPMEETAFSGDYNNFLDAHEEIRVPLDRMVRTFILKGEKKRYAVHLRGDKELSLQKLRLDLGDPSVDFLNIKGVLNLGLQPGFISPLGIPAKIEVLVDESVAGSTNLVIPGTKEKTALLNSNFGRDYDGQRLGDWTRVAGGSTCKFCGSQLQATEALELGHIFKLGDFYTKKMALRYQRETGSGFFPHMGSYGIGIGRLLAAVAHQHSQNNGIAWPRELVPYEIFLMAIGNSNRVRDRVELLYEELGADLVLYDDRKISPGKKFQDCELLGIPIRLVLTRKLLAEGLIECRTQDATDIELWPLDEVKQRIKIIL